MPLVRNYRYQKINGKTELFISPEPQFLEGLEGEVDLLQEYHEVIFTPLEELTAEQEIKFNQYQDILKTFRQPRARAKVILDTEDITNIDAIGRNELIEQAEKNNKINYPRELVFLEGAENTPGEIILPQDDYDKVYIINDDNTIEFIDPYNEVENNERPYYIKADGKTTIYVNHFSGGAGTQSDPYIINTLQELQDINNNLSAYYELGNDIDAIDTFNWNGGAGFEPIGTFTGNFDGKGYVIDNLHIKPSDTNFIGFIMNVEGTVKNVGLTNINYSYEGTENRSYIGGFIYSSASGSLIENCFVNGGSIVNGNYIGGFCRRAYGVVRNCFAKDVTLSVRENGASGDVGGFVASTISGMEGIFESYSSCSTSGDLSEFRQRGFVGYDNYTGIDDTNYNNVDKMPPEDNWNSDAIQLTTAQMKDQSNYTAFDFTNDWAIDSQLNDGYPFPKIFENAFKVAPEFINLSASVLDNETVELSAEMNDYDTEFTNVNVYFEYREEGAGTWISTTAQTASQLTTVTETLTLDTLKVYEYRAVANYNTTEYSYSEIKNAYLADFFNYDFDLSSSDIFSHSQTELNEGNVILVFDGNPPYTESFETDFGDWYNDPAHDYDWQRKSGGTSSGSTGPSSAYDGSYYIYLEASSDSTGDISNLVYDLPSAVTGKLSFAYHMYGNSQGTFTVESFDGTDWIELFRREGNQGNQWFLEEVTFINATKLRFKNIAGSSYTGDLALDLITVEVGELYSSGYTILNPTPLTEITSAGDSLIDWIAGVKSTGEVNIYTAVNTDNTTAPTNWTAETAETSIDSLVAGADLSTSYLWIKAELVLNSDDASPTFSGYEVMINNGEGGGTETHYGSSESTILVAIEQAGYKTLSAGAEVLITVNVESAGESALETYSGSSEVEVLTSTEYVGEKQARAPPAESKVAVGTEDKTDKISLGNSENIIEINVEGQGEMPFIVNSGSSETLVSNNLEAQGEKKINERDAETGVILEAENNSKKINSGKSQPGLEIITEASGEMSNIIFSGSSESSLNLKAEESGLKIFSENSEIKTKSQIETDSKKNASGLSKTDIFVEAETESLKKIAGAKEVKVETSKESYGLKSKQAGSQTNIHSEAEAEALKLISFSKEISVELKTEGSGAIKGVDFAGSSEIKTSAVPEGEGYKNTEAQSQSVTEIITEADGGILGTYFSGYSSSQIEISKEEASLSLKRGSSETEISLEDEAEGNKKAKDISEIKLKTETFSDDGRVIRSGSSEIKSKISVFSAGEKINSGKKEVLTETLLEFEGRKNKSSQSQTGLYIKTFDSYLKSNKGESEVIQLLKLESQGISSNEYTKLYNYKSSVKAGLKEIHSASTELKAGNKKEKEERILLKAAAKKEENLSFKLKSGVKKRETFLLKLIAGATKNYNKNLLIKTGVKTLKEFKLNIIYRYSIFEVFEFPLKVVTGQKFSKKSSLKLKAGLIVDKIYSLYGRFKFPINVRSLFEDKKEIKIKKSKKINIQTKKDKKINIKTKK